jgi:hypothetical protein
MLGLSFWTRAREYQPDAVFILKSFAHDSFKVAVVGLSGGADDGDQGSGAVGCFVHGAPLYSCVSFIARRLLIAVFVRFLAEQKPNKGQRARKKSRNFQGKKIFRENSACSVFRWFSGGSVRFCSRTKRPNKKPNKKAPRRRRVRFLGFSLSVFRSAVACVVRFARFHVR